MCECILLCVLRTITPKLMCNYIAFAQQESHVLLRRTHALRAVVRSARDEVTISFTMTTRLLCVYVCTYRDGQFRQARKKFTPENHKLFPSKNNDDCLLLLLLGLSCLWFCGHVLYNSLHRLPCNVWKVLNVTAQKFLPIHYSSSSRVVAKVQRYSR